MGATISIMKSVCPVPSELILSDALSWDAKKIYLYLLAAFCSGKELDLVDINAWIYGDYSISQDLLDNIQLLEEMNLVKVDELINVVSIIDPFVLIQKKIKKNAKYNPKLKKKIQVSEVAQELSIWFKDSIFDSLEPVDESRLRSWGEAFDKMFALVKKDRGSSLNPEALKKALLLMKNEPFWQDKSFTPLKMLEKTKDGRLMLYITIDKYRRS